MCGQTPLMATCEQVVQGCFLLSNEPIAVRFAVLRVAEMVKAIADAVAEFDKRDAHSARLKFYTLLMRKRLTSYDARRKMRSYDTRRNNWQ